MLISPPKVDFTATTDEFFCMLDFFWSLSIRFCPVSLKVPKLKLAAEESGIVESLFHHSGKMVKTSKDWINPMLL